MLPTVLAVVGSVSTAVALMTKLYFEISRHIQRLEQNHHNCMEKAADQNRLIEHQEHQILSMKHEISDLKHQVEKLEFELVRRDREERQ